MGERKAKLGRNIIFGKRTKKANKM